MGSAAGRDKGPRFAGAWKARKEPGMKERQGPWPANTGDLAVLAACAGVLGLVGGLGFALWAMQGKAVVRTLGDTLLAWCL